MLVVVRLLDIVALHIALGWSILGIIPVLRLVNMNSVSWWRADVASCMCVHIYGYTCLVQWVFLAFIYEQSVRLTGCQIRLWYCLGSCGLLLLFLVVYPGNCC